MITVKYDAIDTSNLDHDEIGAECSVLNPTYSSDATTLHYISSSLVIRDLTESITRAHNMSLFATPATNKSTHVSDGHGIGTTKSWRDTEKWTNVHILEENPCFNKM
ncbi:hypothetical protein YC2023_101604 [Brassica napus]